MGIISTERKYNFFSYPKFFFKKFFFPLLGGALLGFLSGFFLLGHLVSAPSLEQTASVGSLFGTSAVIGVGNISFFAGWVFLALSVLTGISIAYALRSRKAIVELVTRIKENQYNIKTKDDFISMILHHVRTPLTGMMWGMNSIIKNPGEDNKEKLGRIYEENMRVLRSVDELMKVSKASLGRITYHLEPLKVRAIAASVRESTLHMQALAESKKLKYEMHFDEGSDNSIKVDIQKILSVVETLLENAIFYTKEEGTIKISTEEKDGYWLYHVKDNGIGIPEKDKARIFVQFFRSENAQRLIPDGLGIGLYTAKTFLQYHSGDVWFDSSEGEGTTFHLKLPLIQEK